MTDIGTVVELRVHGVSGAPPEALLGCPAEDVERTAGDADAGFYRRKPGLDEAAGPSKPDGWRRVMEAYSWGALTSGKASRALWLLFLPFILIDLAHWMLPPAGRRRPAAISVTLLRLIALSFTLTLMLAAAIAVMDVIVWQCVGLDYCSAGPLTFMEAWPRGWQLAASALPLVAAIALLWRLGAEETKVDTDGRDAPPSPAVLEQDTPLAQNSFWNPDESVLRLRYCHVTAWAAGLAAVVLAAPVEYAASPTARVVGVGLLAVDGLILAIAVLATASSKATARGGNGVNHVTRPLYAVRGISLGMLVAALLWAGVADVSYPPAPGHLPGLHMAIYVLFVVQVVMLCALFVFTALSMRGTQTAERTTRDGGYRMTLSGFTGPFVALVGWLIGGGFSVGVGLGIAQVFGRPMLSAETAQTPKVDAPLIVPPPYVWAAVATVATIAVAIAVGAYVWLRVIPRRVESQLSEVRTDYPGVTGPSAQLDTIARARALASLTDVGARSLAAMALVAVITTAGALIVNLSVPQFSSFNWSTWIFRISVFISAALAAGLVLLAAAAYRNRQLRRAVAILWDVVTFWPRANHPLTPPSYGARTVWDVRLRLDGFRRAGVPVVLVAHSQGTVIAGATLLQANTATEHYPLLTFGSPLRRLYAQNFPAYFGAEALGRLRQWQLQPNEQWINLWCCSDPIGAWIFDDENTEPRLAQSEHIDWRLFDVPRTGSVPDPGGRVCGHSGFWTRKEYDDAMTALQSTVLPEGSAPADTSATAPPTKELQ
ncbi:hypothetical protein [Mycobacterium sp. OAE908]|uniref:hypothetical protein n=1 Tax=Mycobacterium sp. OAE908 TaxID=2817899 RepID=UPI001AE24579